MRRSTNLTLLGVVVFAFAYVTLCTGRAEAHDGYHPFPSEIGAPVKPLPPVRGVPPGYVPPRLTPRAPRLPSLAPSRAERYAPEGWYVDPVSGGIVWIWPAQ